MKRQLLYLTMFLLGGMTAFAQAPSLMNYQGVARSAAGSPLASQPIGMRLTIHDATASGPVVFQETQTTTTNAFGLYNVAIGGGTPGTGTIAGVNWGSGNKYLEVELDPTGSSSYSSVGSNQLLSVPYAIYAGSASSGGISGTTNYIPVFTSSSTLGNSNLYQNGPRVGINYGTTTHGIVAVRTTPGDSIALYLNSATGHPTIYGIERVEYTGLSDSNRVGILSTMIRSTSDKNGTGIEGAGCGIGVQGLAENNTLPATGSEVEGVEGDSYGSGAYSIGVAGFGYNYTSAPSNCYGVYGTATGGTVNYAGYFQGNVKIIGSIAKTSGTFEIDHPLDPANKYLYHSFVESPDMMNIYNGNVTTDATGTATVTLPDYFEALNKDFRYQLTILGTTFAQALVSKEISGNQFEIKTNQPNIKVSWMVTGVRQDAWANAHRVVPEVDKEPMNKGKYLTPIEQGQPAEMGIGADFKGHSKRDDPAIMSKGSNQK